MLQYLKISDLALLDELTLEFDDGFTTITGETGAGKSILLGALFMLSGARLDRSIIRHGQEQTKVEAVIALNNTDKINEKLREIELPECEDGALILSRTLHVSKAPKIQINGSLSTLNNLSALGEFWIDFHGPGEPQKLFKEKYQLEILDLYSNSAQSLATYQETYQKWRQSIQALESLKNEKQLTPDEIHYLQSQIAQIDELDVNEETIRTLEADFQRLSSIEELTQHLTQLNHSLYEDAGASEKLATALQAMSAISEIDTATTDLHKRMESLAIELDDLSSEIQDLSSRMDLDEVAIENIKSRMDSWMDLKRKHGKEPRAILDARESMHNKLNTHSNIQESLEKLQMEIDTLANTLKAQGNELKVTRESGAQALAEKVSEKLLKLGFAKAQFVIELIDEDTPKAYGTTRCQIRFAPNAGQPLMPLNKIASSGETARVMLALKAVLASFDETPVLVFDEVDANVGGEIGASVGAEMAQIAKEHQIFCVTHLPQVAAQANQHYVVQKNQDDQSTTVSINRLDTSTNARIEELARMLGDRSSESALSHARSLLR